MGPDANDSCAKRALAGPFQDEPKSGRTQQMRPPTQITAHTATHKQQKQTE